MMSAGFNRKHPDPIHGSIFGQAISNQSTHTKFISLFTLPSEMSQKKIEIKGDDLHSQYRYIL